MAAQQNGNLYVETPLVYSPHISSLLDANVYLKLDNLQPAQSFKSRGISHFAQQAVKTHGPGVHLVIASGGNAGLAAACAARALAVRCTVFLPRLASPATVDFLRKEGAETVIEGEYYLQALQGAERAVAADAHAVMIPAYDDDVVQDGHATIVHEARRQLPAHAKPDAIFCSVGGGGLAAGIMKGCKAVEWDDVPLVAVETHGSNCFYQSLALNPGPFGEGRRSPPEGVRAEESSLGVAVAHLATLTSKATSLGATSPSAAAVKLALERQGSIKSLCVSDEMTMQAALFFAEDHKILVELACAATLTPAYNPALFDALVPPRPAGEKRNVVFVVCGGFKVMLSDMAEYKLLVEKEVEKGGDWEVSCNGKSWGVAK